MSNIQDRLQALFPVHYRSGNVLLLNADCMEVMKHIRNDEFELSCVDPPYGIGIGATVGGGSHLDRKVIVGGEGLSRPKFIRGLMTAKSQTKSILKSLYGFLEIKLFGGVIILLKHLETPHAGLYGIKTTQAILQIVSLLGQAIKHQLENLNIGGMGCFKGT